MAISMDTSAKMAVIALTVLCLSASWVICYPFYVQAVYQPQYIIKADKLAEKPESYMHLENPDAYVSQAISSQDGVLLHSLDDTQIDELINQQTRENRTSNFQVNGNFYQIGILFGDKFPPAGLSFLFLISPIILILAVVSLIVIATFKFAKKQSKKTKYSLEGARKKPNYSLVAYDAYSSHQIIKASTLKGANNLT
jgi:hypothetical protein